MRKRISCRVVRSIPLSKSSDALRHTSRSNNRHHKIGDVAAGTPTGFPFCDILQNGVLTKECVWEGSHFVKDCKMGPKPSPNAQVGHSDNPATYIDRLGIARVPTGDGLTAQILDFYV